MKNKKIVAGVISLVCVGSIALTSIKLSNNYSFEKESLMSNNYLNKQDTNEEIGDFTNETLNINSDLSIQEDTITTKEVQLASVNHEVIEDDLTLTEDVVVEEQIVESYNMYNIRAQEELAVFSSEEVVHVTTYEELKAAIESGTNIELDSNITMGPTIKINKTINLNLNGYTLESPNTMFSIANEGVFNVTAGNGGKMQLTSTGSRCIFNINGGTVNVEDGIYTSNGNWVFYVAAGNLNVNDGIFTANGKYMMYAKGGKIELKGGSYTANNSGDYMMVAFDCELNIYGGDFNASRKYMLYFVRANINITGGNFVAHDTPKGSYMILINHTPTDLNISNANFTTNNKLFYFWGKDRENQANVNITSGKFVSTIKDEYAMSLNDNIKVEVTGGEIEILDGSGIAMTSEDPDMSDPAIKLIWGREGAKEGPSITAKAIALAGNFAWSSTMVTVNSGEIISKEASAVYQPQQGIFIMNGGIIKGLTGIDMKMGQFTFNGGYVVGIGDKNRISASKKGFTDESHKITGGTVVEGSAIAIQSEIYGSSESNKGSVGNASGELSSGHYPDETYGNSFALTINDGVFISKNHSPITLYDWNYNECKQYIDVQITGGRFSGFPQKYVAKYEESDTKEGSIIDDSLTKEYLFIPSENAKDGDEYSYVHAAYYDGVDLEYDFTGKDAPYYASMADAIEDRENDQYARAYIYYLLNNGNRKYNDATISKQLQIVYGKDICGQYIPDSVEATGLFESDFDEAEVKYNEAQYVKNNVLDIDKTVATLWSPAVTFNSNSGTFENGEDNKIVTASIASGLINADGYGYAQKSSASKIYATLDENDRKLDLENKYLLEIPQEPVKDGYKFIGYFYDEEGNNKFDPATTQIKENLTVYANYEKIRKGGLIVSNTIGGSSEKFTHFNFIINLSDTSINGQYGDVAFVNGVSEFSLKNNEYVTISDLPADIQYEIIEMGANEDGVVTVVKNSVGTILDDEVVNVEFSNSIDEKDEKDDKEDKNDEDNKDVGDIEKPKDEDNVHTGDNIIMWLLVLLSQIGVIVGIVRKKSKKDF